MWGGSLFPSLTAGTMIKGLHPCPFVATVAGIDPGSGGCRGEADIMVHVCSFPLISERFLICNLSISVSISPMMRTAAPGS